MKKIKFNILDAFIILFVLCIGFVFATKFFGADVVFSGGEYTSVQYVVKVESMRGFTAESIPESGARFLVEESGNDIGSVVRKDVQSALATQTLANGEVVRSEVKDRYDVYITVQAEGIQQADGYYVNGNHCLNVGSFNTFRVGNVVIYGCIYEINEIKD